MEFPETENLASRRDINSGSMDSLLISRCSLAEDVAAVCCFTLKPDRFATAALTRRGRPTEPPSDERGAAFLCPRKVLHSLRARHSCSHDEAETASMKLRKHTVNVANGRRPETGGRIAR